MNIRNSRQSAHSAPRSAVRTGSLSDSVRSVVVQVSVSMEGVNTTVSCVGIPTLTVRTSSSATTVGTVEGRGYVSMGGLGTHAESART